MLSRDFPKGMPTEWGDVRPFRVRSTARNYGEAADFWEEQSKGYNIVFGRTRAGFRGLSKITASFACGPASRRTHTVDVEFKENVAGDPDATASALRALTARWIEILEPDFARVCSDEEWRAKHVVESYLEADGSTTPWKVFHQNIVDGLPGVYWLTYFGRMFVDWIGEARFSQRVWPSAKKVANGYLLQRSECVSTWRTEQELDELLIRHLGTDRFFDKREPCRWVTAPNFDMPNPYAFDPPEQL